MSKLTEIQQQGFKRAFSMYKHDWKEQAFFIYDKEQKVCVLGVFSGPSRKHVKITTAQCGDSDVFKKKIGFTICAKRIVEGQFVTVPAISTHKEDSKPDISTTVWHFAYNMYKNDELGWMNL
jgi:hypothetical protein